jgi:hypothetical protein
MEIQQVLTNQPQGPEKQLPVVDGSPFFGNINMIEIRADQSPDYIFQKYIQTYAAVVGSANDNANMRNQIMFFTNSKSSPGPDTIHVTGPNQTRWITVRG